MAQQLLRQDTYSTDVTAHTSRRNFLRSGAALILGASLPTASWLSGCQFTREYSQPIWDELSARLSGTLLRPGNPVFAEKASPWALKYATTVPQAIAVCASETDVQTCLQWARANNVGLVARAGGHSYGGYSTTTGLIISTAGLSTINYNSGSNRLTVGGGIRNADVRSFIQAQSLNKAITHGRCPGVGVAGLVLGGGIGFNMRAHGFTCDQLRETRMVLADGRILTCNESENADLFWACRGAGGGNFGIHTSFTFEPFTVTNLSVFDLTWTRQLPQVVAAIQDMTRNAPRTLGLKLSLIARKQSGVTVLNLSLIGQLAGPLSELTALLVPILHQYKPDRSDISYVPYWDGQDKLTDPGLPEYSHERSRFVKGDLSTEAIALIFDQLTAWPGTSKQALWKYFLLGGAINDKRVDAMAFAHRGYSMLSSLELEWGPDDSRDLLAQNEQWLGQFHEQMEPHTSSASYQNFIDPSQRGYLQAYHGSNLAQLRTVKRKYDPSNMFAFSQSIPV
jgi:FAD/FMN-containing dehydrogenase